MPWELIPKRPYAMPLAGWCRSARGACDARYLGSRQLSFINHASALFALPSARGQRKPAGDQKTEGGQRRPAPDGRRADWHDLVHFGHVNISCAGGLSSAAAGSADLIRLRRFGIRREAATSAAITPTAAPAAVAGQPAG